jgi:GTP-binding protein
MNDFTVLIVGRPNVGKSTLFNRLNGRRQALVLDVPGVTRDRNESRVAWYRDGKPYVVRLVDTGGLAGEAFDKEISEQVRSGMRSADVIVVVFDGRSGFVPQDREALDEIRKHPDFSRLPVIGVVNKVDEENLEDLAHEFHEAGLDELLTISAEHGRGIDDLKLRVLDFYKGEPSAQEDVDDLERAGKRKSGSLVPRIAVVGRPNVGKSTLVNALLGEERMITSPIAGTTVDSVDSQVELDGHEFVLVDTAGIRRKSKTEQGVEVLSVVMARKALERADLALLVVDADAGISDQDAKVASLCEQAGTSVAILVNKWDLREKRPGSNKKSVAEEIRRGLKFLSWAPVVFTSGLKRKGIKGLGDLMADILEQKGLKLQAKELTEYMRDRLHIHNPDGAKIFYVHQSGSHPPTFVGHVNDPEKVRKNLERQLIVGMRERWGYMGSPIRLKFERTGRTQASSGRPTR